VINRYDINGYFTKVEATEDKLYSRVKSGVSEIMFAQTAVSLLDRADGCFGLARRYVRGRGSGRCDGRRESQVRHLYRWASRFRSAWIRARAQDVRDRLLKMPCKSLGMPSLPFPTEDDCYVIDNNDTLIHVPETQVTAVASYVSIATAPAPTDVRRARVQVHARVGKSVEEGDVDRDAY
jgi:hypothetical protein